MQPVRREFEDKKLGMTLVVGTAPERIEASTTPGSSPALGFFLSIFATGEESRRRLATAAGLKPQDVPAYVREGGDFELLRQSALNREFFPLPDFNTFEKILHKKGIVFDPAVLAQARVAYEELSKQQPNVESWNKVLGR